MPIHSRGSYQPALTATLISIIFVAGCQSGQNAPEGRNEQAVRAWLEAGQLGKAESIAAAESLMADDGTFYRPRYVGMGFTWDNRDEATGMIVQSVIPSSPASGVLEVGDEFVSVRGVAITQENRDSGALNFRGKPGETIAAIIRRDGAELEVAMTRGIIDPMLNKTEFIEWMSLGDEEDWADDEFIINEIISQGNVSYAWVTIKNTDKVSGLPWETHAVGRFVFNDEGKIVATGNLREDRFILEQLGFSINR